ncbi:MAG: exported protein of unknown function [Myxococcales bacterium]|nr:exported protein of unknown function [Myxococcales bacterium]
MQIRTFLVFALAAHAAYAEPVGDDLPIAAGSQLSAAGSNEDTEATVAAPPPPAVAPDRISGVEIDDQASSGRAVPRVVLYPVRIGTEIVIAPIRGGAWLLERFQLRDRIMHLLFSDDGTFGIYPTAFIETEVGWNVGLHVVDTNLFGHRERLAIGLGYGGEFKQRYDASLTSGPILGGSRIGLRLSYRAWDRSNFFGIGNANVASMVMPQQIDALHDNTSLHTRFAQDVAHVEIQSATPIAGPLSFGLVAAYTHRTFSTAAQLDGFQPTLDIYSPMSLVGFETGADNFYGETSLLLDTRTVADRYISTASPSSGWWARASLGFAQGAAGDPSHYARYNADLRRCIDLYRGDRVLVLRGYLEGVTASRDAIPFTDLPRIGGNELLRGYEHDRFRDRIVAVASAEYDFPIHRGLTGYGFIDAGRTAERINELEPKNLHVGVGGGLQFQTLDSFLFRFQLAHSVDGTFLRFALDPAYDLRAKNRRK